jgi:hypothetical protein
MKKLLLLLLCVPLIGLGQFSIGNDQIICLGDTSELVAFAVVGSQGAGIDTVIAGSHDSDNSSNMTRGWWFQAQSSFTISGIHCSDDNTAGFQLGTNQSVEIIDFGVLPPIISPGPGGQYNTLFSAIDVPEGWITCNVITVPGNYYGIIGAKHEPVTTGSSSIMYNSYASTGPQTFIIDGHPIVAKRLILQSSLCMGSPVSGSYMSQNNGSIGRIDIMTYGGVHWYDINTGQMIGDGDTIYYSPYRSTFVSGVITDSLSYFFSDTMYIEVLNNSSSYDTLVSSVNISWNGMILTNSGDYSFTLINSSGCDSIANLNLTINTTGIVNLDHNNKTVIKIIDVLGREKKEKTNEALFYIYDDGTVEKKIIIE